MATEQDRKDFVMKLVEFWQDDVEPEIYSPEGKFHDFTRIDVIEGLVNFCVAILASKVPSEELLREFHDMYCDVAAHIIEEIQEAEEDGREPFEEYL